MISYTDIVLKTFAFIKTDIPQDLYDHIWSLDFPDTGIDPEEIRYKIQGTDEVTRKKIIEYILSQDIDPSLMVFIKDFQFDINKIRQNEFVPMHNEVSQKSPFEVVFWLTKTDNYQGREFIMLKNGIESRIQPKNGTMCFLDTTPPDVYHGVSKLITDTEIITVTGGTGRKNVRQD